ncbi:MAG TPA: OmpH family outer membrane protein [Opitutaceae bacterium]|jgi:outer membrane protein
MKKLTHTLLAVGSMLSAALVSHAQTEPKVVTVDLEKIFSTHYETVAEEAKLKAQGTTAQDDLNKLIKDRSDLVDQYKALDEQVNNPVTTADAKAKAQSDEKAKAQEIQQKERDMQNFAQSARQTLAKSYSTFRSQLLDEISKLVLTVAKSHGATLVLNTGGHFAEGTTTVLYADPSYDVTEEVIAQINKNKPAGTPAAPAAASSSTAPAGTSDSTPHFSVPNVTPSSQ